MVTRDEMIAKWVSGNSMSDNIDKMEGERRNHRRTISWRLQGSGDYGW